VDEVSYFVTASDVKFHSLMYVMQCLLSPSIWWFSCTDVLQ